MYPLFELYFHVIICEMYRARQKSQNDMCVKRRLGAAWDQFDQVLPVHYIGRYGPKPFFTLKQRLLSDWAVANSLGVHVIFVYFVMLWLKFSHQVT